jgi:hypothetical protein
MVFDRNLTTGIRGFWGAYSCFLGYEGEWNTKLCFDQSSQELHVLI